MRGGLTRTQGACLCFNCVVGCGFLSLPSVFATSGVVAASAMLVAASALLLVTALLEGEIILRCSAVKHFHGVLTDSMGPSQSRGRQSDSTTTRFHRGSERLPLGSFFPDRSYTAVATSGDRTEGQTESAGELLSHLSAERSLTMTEVCDVLLGKRGKLGYCWMLLLYQAGTLWS